MLLDQFGVFFVIDSKEVRINGFDQAQVQRPHVGPDTGAFIVSQEDFLGNERDVLSRSSLFEWEWCI